MKKEGVKRDRFGSILPYMYAEEIEGDVEYFEDDMDLIDDTLDYTQVEGVVELPSLYKSTILDMLYSIFMDRDILLAVEQVTENGYILNDVRPDGSDNFVELEAYGLGEEGFGVFFDGVCVYADDLEILEKEDFYTVRKNLELKLFDVYEGEEVDEMEDYLNGSLERYRPRGDYEEVVVSLDDLEFWGVEEEDDEDD